MLSSDGPVPDDPAHDPERPGVSPMIPAGRAGSRSTIEVIHGSLRVRPVSLKNHRTLRALVSSTPIIIVVGAACPSASTAVATRTFGTRAAAHAQLGPQRVMAI
jgi:hypothetical protein